jgi:hypothetical protein
MTLSSTFCQLEVQQIKRLQGLGSELGFQQKSQQAKGSDLIQLPASDECQAWSGIWASSDLCMP